MIWKEIKGYENSYWINNFGYIKRIYSNGSEKVLKQQLNKGGYLYVCLCKNGTKKFVRVHKLVAETFIKNDSKNKEINHINGIKTDNRVENLEYVSRSENLLHAYRCGLEKRQYNNPKKSKLVNQYDLHKNLIKTWESLCEIQRCLNFNKQNISSCCNKKILTAYGYYWNFAEVDN